MHRRGASLYAVMNYTTADAIPSPKAHGRSLIVNVEGGPASPSWPISLRHFDQGVIDTPRLISDDEWNRRNEARRAAVFEAIGISGSQEWMWRER